MNLQFDFEKKRGKIKPMHAVGQPPFAIGVNEIESEMFHFLKEANIPYSRMHDVGGAFGGNMFVDIPNLFRDFDADENDPDSYDFIFTDKLFEALIEQEDPHTSNYFGFMVVAKDKSEAVLTAYRRMGSVNNEVKYLKVSGLDENKTYSVSGYESAFKGSTLMNIGLPAKFKKGDFMTSRYFFKEV